jgi:hypothetical protein
VERLVCNYRKVQRIAERQRANTLHEQRCVNFHHDDDGALVLEARLPPETGAIVLEALAVAGEAMTVRRRELDAAEQTKARRKNSAESFRDTDIETLNHEQGLDIDARTCVFPGSGARMDHAMAVEELLHRDGALHLDPATGHYPAHFPRVQQDG